MREREREREVRGRSFFKEGIFCIRYLKRRVPTKLSRRNFTSHLYFDTFKRYVKRERILLRSKR